MYDLWQEMRAHDAELSRDVLETTFALLQAQTDKQRLEQSGLGKYLEYREKDVGKA